MPHLQPVIDAYRLLVSEHHVLPTFMWRFGQWKTFAENRHTCRSLFFIRLSVTRPFRQSLATCPVLFRVDYGNEALDSIPSYFLQRLQSMMNAVARLIYSSSKFDTCMSVLHIVGPKCALAASHAARWWVTVSIQRDGRTPDRCITLSAINAASAIIEVTPLFCQLHRLKAPSVWPRTLTLVNVYRFSRLISHHCLSIARAFPPSVTAHFRCRSAYMERLRQRVTSALHPPTAFRQNASENLPILTVLLKFS